MQILDFHRQILSSLLLPQTDADHLAAADVNIPPTSALIVLAPGLGLSTHILPKLLHVYAAKSSLVLVLNANKAEISSLNLALYEEYGDPDYADWQAITWFDSDTSIANR